MSIRTITLEQASQNFVMHFRNHLAPSSPARLIDPRNCDACIRAYDDLKFALERDDHRKRVSPNISILDDAKILHLYE